MGCQPCTYLHVKLLNCYRRRGKIHWLNIHSFNYIEVFVEILLRCYGQKCLLLSIIKENLYSHKTFAVVHKNHKSLAQQIFPCLWYSFSHVATLIQTYVLVAVKGATSDISASFFVLLRARYNCKSYQQHPYTCEYTIITQ